MVFQLHCVWLLLGMAVSAQAEQSDPSDKEVLPEVAAALDTGEAPAAATIEKIMEQAARNIAARYNLNEAQTDITQELMTREVHRFLKEHENEIWPVIRDLLSSQLGAKPPDSREDIMRIGKAARPLAELAKEAIFRANREWRAILTAEQQRVHDFDLAEMENTFEQIDKNFGTWEAGRPAAGGIFPRAQIDGRQPPRPPKPPEVQPELKAFDPNPILEILVEEFIKDYQLDEGQLTSVRSILEEFKGKANDYKVSKKLELAAIAAEREEALKRRDLAGVRKAAKVHKKLLEPIFQLCEHMQDRLTGLLTTAQIQRHAEKAESTDDASKRLLVRKRTPPKKTVPSETGSANSDSRGEDDGE